MTVVLRVIDAETIRQLAPAEKLIGWMRDAMMLVSQRDATLPLRQGMPLPDGAGAIGMMPGHVGGDIQSAGVKLVSLVPPERRRGSSHLGPMMLYDADGLLPVALLCGATITAIRTSAVTAMATDLLARKDARTLAILGAGEQAQAHLRALRMVRRFDDIRIWNHKPERAAALAAQENARACSSVAEAIEGADVICTVTAAREPILLGDMVGPGSHVNLVGSSFPEAREVDDEMVRKARFFIDYQPSTMAQAGEFLHAREAGIVDDSHIVAEIGAVAAGEAEGRRSDDDITLYKSLGVAAQDIVTARRVYALACEAGLGQMVTI